MNSKKTEIDKLKDEEKFSWRKDLPLFVIPVIFYSIFLNLPNIVDSLNLIDPLLAKNFQKIIKQAFSYRDDFLIFSLFFIILSIIWPFFRKYRIRLKRIKLIEKKLDESRSKNEQLEKELDKCQSDNKCLERLTRLQSQSWSITTSGEINISISKPDTPSSFEINMKPKPDTPISPETKNNTDHATIPTTVIKPIDSGKGETLYIYLANFTAKPPNEDQE